MPSRKRKEEKVLSLPDWARVESATEKTNGAVFLREKEGRTATTVLGRKRGGEDPFLFFPP